MLALITRLNSEDCYAIILQVVKMFVSNNYRMTDTIDDLFNEDNYIYLNAWNQTFWFCACNYIANVNQLSNPINLDQTKTDCDMNPITKKECIDDTDDKIEVCHLARRKRSTDRHKTLATRKYIMEPKMVTCLTI